MSYRLSVGGALASGLVALALPQQAHAQANYDGMKLGGRTAIMGGAAVARGSDGATAFVNPAGITRIPGQSFSFGTFALELSGYKINNLLDPGESYDLEDGDAAMVNVRILPNTFCLFLDGPPKDHYSGRSRHKFGICAADAEKADFNFTRNALEDLDGAGEEGTGVSHSTRMRWKRTSVAFDWGFEIERGLSIGVAARLENSHYDDQTAATAVADFGGAADMQTVTRAVQSWSWDAFVVLGLQYQINRFLTLGASFSTPSQHIIGKHRAFESFAPATGETKGLVQDDGDFRYNQPTNLRLGLAFTWPTFNFEVNASYYGAENQLATAVFDRNIVETENGVQVEQFVGKGSLVERSKPVMNLMAGAEVFVDSDFSVLFGAQTDWSGLARREDSRPADTLFRRSVDTIYASVGAATYGKAGSLLLGLRGFYSLGDVLVADAAASEPAYVAVPLSQWGLSLVISGQISFKSVRNTAVRATAPLSSIPSALEPEAEGTGDEWEGLEDEGDDESGPSVNPYEEKP